LVTAIANKPQILVLLLFLVLPGFLVVRVFDRLHPGEPRSTVQLIIEAGIFSLSILAIWFMPTLVLLQLGPDLPYWLYHLLFFALILLGVFATPLLIVYILHRLELRGTLKPLRPEPSPTPSDWIFSGSPDDHYYVLFHRKEGKDLGGYFGERSFAATSANGQEIYVEEVWQLDEDGKFIERVEGTRGAIVNTEECDLIVFFETPKARDERTLDEGRIEPSKKKPVLPANLWDVDPPLQVSMHFLCAL